MQRVCFLLTGWAAVLLWAAGQNVLAQQPPSIGYLYPPAAQAGQSIDVVLGGYDWTPDMQLFVHAPGVELEIVGPPSEILVPEPPYWFGAKARRPPFPLPREIPARLTIPAATPPGVVRWQAANANGATASGRLLILPPRVAGDPSASEDAPAASLRETRPLRDAADQTHPQRLASLPVFVSGRIEKIEEVDRYTFTSARSGPVTCSVVAHALGSALNAVLEVRDLEGELVADAAATTDNDLELTFFAEADQRYHLSVFDLDFRGDRSLVYGLSLVAGPRVVAAIPAAGQRGETRDVELIGYGVGSGAAKLESVTRQIAFPNDPATTHLAYSLVTPHGVAPEFILPVSELSEATEPSDSRSEMRRLSVPAAVTGVLDEPLAEDRYLVSGKLGEFWAIDLWAERIGSPLDVAVAVLDGEGKELARADDRAGSTDAAVEFKVPADDDYQISVTDVGGQAGRRDAVYRLSVKRAEPDFSLAAPELVNLPISGKVQLQVTATRTAGFTGEIALSVDGLPVGVMVPDTLTIAQGKATANIELTAAADAAAVAALVSVRGEAPIGEQVVRRSTDPWLLAATIKPPFAVDAEGKDDVTKWPRGTTYPAPVLIERDADFDGELVLEMSSRQGRHRQGIRGPELVVPNGVERILYPVYLPEWLETTRTSRMVVNAVAQVPDPQGNLRYCVSRQKTRMGFLPTGALLKLTAEVAEVQVQAGQGIIIPVTVDRSPQLTGPVQLELASRDGSAALFTAAPRTLPADQAQAEFAVTWCGSEPVQDEQLLTLRATAWQQGTLPVISQTTVVVQVAGTR